MFKPIHHGHMDSACEFAGLSHEWASALARAGLVGTLDRFVAFETMPGRFQISCSERNEILGRPTRAAPLSDRLAGGSAEPVRPCRLETYSECISNQCDEDGICRRYGVEFKQC